MKFAVQMGFLAALGLLVMACAGRSYRPESVAAKMQRYESQDSAVAIQSWEIDPSYFQQRRPSSTPATHQKLKQKSKQKRQALNKRRNPRLQRLGNVKIGRGDLPPRPLGQIYFLSLLEQYYQLGQFLPEATPPLKICANFHDVLVRENVYPYPKKQKLPLPSAALLAQKSYLFPLGQLPLADQTTSLGKTIQQSTAAGPQLLVAAEDALRGLQQKIYQELWQLCDGERAYSINRDNLLNLARFKDDHPLTPTPHHLQVLFNIFPLSNWALIDSLGASPRRPLYAEQILTALDAAWFKDYLQDQQRQRQRVRQPASDGEGQY